MADIMSFKLSLWTLGILSCIVAWYGVFRYGELINPLTAFSVTQIGLYTLFSGIVANFILQKQLYNYYDSVKTVLISIVYLFGNLLPYLFRGPLPSNLFGKIMSFLGLDSETPAKRFNIIKFSLFLVCMFGVYIALMQVGGGGTLWLTKTRIAYSKYRTGAGIFFLMTQWISTFALLFYLWSRRPSGLNLLLLIVVFASLAFFTGSKKNILVVFVISLCYYNFSIKRISLFYIMIILCLLFLTFLSLLYIQGSYSSLVAAPLYFKDYFDTSARFISRFDELGYHYGRGWLSSFWFYVPRHLYPDKPYEYGHGLIHQILFPGAAKLGHTPGILKWSLAYLDFGAIGVFIIGLLGGFVQRMAYEYFLRYPRRFFAFVLMMQFSIWPIFSFASEIPVLFMCIFCSLFLRLIFVKSSKNSLHS